MESKLQIGGVGGWYVHSTQDCHTTVLVKFRHKKKKIAQWLRFKEIVDLSGKTLYRKVAVISMLAGGGHLSVTWPSPCGFLRVSITNCDG